ncbi:hypothetical protein GF319_05705 [Candidatus Bathyarchaeota archaeon]|nr:hypothetical protein [Candidatus Bathyarchaeota archaeon]
MGKDRSRRLIEWVFLPAYAMIGLHAVLFELGRRRGIEFVKVNAKFIVYLVLLGPLVISIQNASQYYNWYWDPVRNAPGFVDVWTHVTSSLLLGSLLAPFAFERFLGWERKWFWFPVFALLMASSLLWEIGETIQTMDGQSIEYFNYPLDSLKDIIFGGVFASILSTWIYERIVIHCEK